MYISYIITIITNALQTHLFIVEAQPAFSFVVPFLKQKVLYLIYVLFLLGPLLDLVMRSRATAHYRYFDRQTFALMRFGPALFSSQHKI